MSKIKHERKISYRSTDKAGQPVAFIPVQGKFLSDYGFEVGDRVNVNYSAGLIHISKIIADRYGDAAACCVVR